MKYHRVITLKNGTECCLRNGIESDSQAVLDNFDLTHGETDYLLSYPDENTFDVEKERQYLKEKQESPNEVEIVAIIDDTVAGTAGICAIGSQYKVRHRAEFGTSIAKEYWGLGIGQVLLRACIECAKTAGYTQLELEVVADNTRAIAMYKKTGFVEYGRNPKGFQSRTAGFQEIVYMRLKL